MDRDRLVKLLAMTTSTNDHEALAALRMANLMLSKEKLTWAEILADSGTTINIALRRDAPAPYQTDEHWVAPHLRDKVTIDMMFRCIYAQRDTHSGAAGFWTFIDSIHRRWTRYGNLSQGQYSALMNCYKRALRTSQAAS